MVCVCVNCGLWNVDCGPWIVEPGYLTMFVVCGEGVDSEVVRGLLYGAAFQYASTIRGI